MTLSQKKIIPNSQIPFNDIPKISLIGALKQIQDILANADKMKDQPIDANNNNNVSSQSNDSLNPFLKRQNLISKKKFENADTSQQHDEWDFNFDITKNQVLFEKEKPISKDLTLRSKNQTQKAKSQQKSKQETLILSRNEIMTKKLSLTNPFQKRIFTKETSYRGKGNKYSQSLRLPGYKKVKIQIQRCKTART
eukprot:403370536